MRVMRRTLQVVLIVATLIVGAAAAAIVVTQTAWFRDWARGLIVSQGNRYLDGTLSIDRLGGNLFFGVELENVRVEQRGERVIAVRNAGVDYSILQLLTGDLVIDHIRLDQPRIVLRRENGRLNLGTLVKRERREKERTGPGRSVSIGEIGISDGTIRVEEGAVGTSGTDIPQVFDKLDASIGFQYEPVRYTVRIGHLSFRGEQPDFQLNELSGKVSQRDDDLYLENVAVRTEQSSFRVDGRIVNYLSQPTLEIVATSDKLVIPEIARLVPALRGIELQPAFRVTARGPLQAVAFDFNTQSSAGEASGQLTAGLRGPDRRLQGRVNLGNFNLAPLVRSEAAQSRITGLAHFDLVLPGDRDRGPVVGTFNATADSVRIAGYAAEDVRARGRVDGVRVTLAEARARAYGGYATAAGVVDPRRGSGPVAERLLLDLRGRVSDLDLRRLPPALRVPAVESRLQADYQVAGPVRSLQGEATLRRSMLAGATLADGTRATFSLAGPETAYTAEGAVEGLNLQRVGREFKIAALEHERFRGEINGDFRVTGSGTKVPSMSLEASANLTNSSLAGAELPAMTVGAHLDNGSGRFTADGDFRGLDLGQVSGRKELAGEVNGRAVIEASIAKLGEPLTPEAVTAKGQIELQKSTVGGLALEGARVAGEYRDATAHLREATVEGPYLNARATGALALGERGSSDLQDSLNTPDLGVVGKLVDQPLKGSLSVEGRVNGNRAELRTTGHLKGSNVGRGENSALSLESDYDVRIPNLDVAAAAVVASPRMAFVKVGGQEITRLEAKATYARRELVVEANAQQAERQARVGGRLVLHPDHQEVHLTSLGIATQGLEWTLAPGTEAAVQYGGDRLEFEGLRLVSGNQRVEVDGTIAPKDSHLRAALSDVDLSRLDTLIVGDRRLGGVLNASAVVTGPRDALRVDGEFAVDRGSFRDFRYETLGGTFGYSSRILTADVRLQQGPATWLAARGTLPMALFQPAPEGKPGAAAEEAAPVDFTVRSSSVDLGLVQGFTSAVTQVFGTLQADVRVTGTARDPHMEGFVEVSGGQFTVPATDVTYRDLAGRIGLQKDRAVIERLGVVDEHGNRLDVAGEVAVHQRALGNLKLTVVGDDFEVLHGDLGHVAVDANLAVAGELRRLRVTGEIEAERGTVAVDELLDKIGGGDAYATSPTPRAEASERAAAAAAGTGGRPAPVPPLTGAGGSQQAAERVSQAAEGGTKAAGAPGTAAPVAGTPAAAPTKPAAEAQAEAAAQGGFYDSAEIDVRVRIPDTLIVRGRDIRPPSGAPIGLGDVNATFGGDLRARKSPGGALVLVGDVRTVRGTYDFQGRRFEIQRDGRIRFEGLSPIDPALDITAVRVISGVEARVQIGGTVRQPELTLTSRPPLPEADILSLIVFNQPANQLGEGQQVSLAQRASALATGFVASKLANSLGKALDLDIFEIEAAPEGAGQGAAVTLGEQVGQRLFLKLRQGVGADPTSQFVAEYQLFDFMRLQTTVSQGATQRSLMRRVEGSGVDLIFFFSY